MLLLSSPIYLVAFCPCEHSTVCSEVAGVACNRFFLKQFMQISKFLLLYDSQPKSSLAPISLFMRIVILNLNYHDVMFTDALMQACISYNNTQHATASSQYRLGLYRIRLRPESSTFPNVAEIRIRQKSLRSRI